jgi:hypothetical protein
VGTAADSREQSEILPVAIPPSVRGNARGQKKSAAMPAVIAPNARVNSRGYYRGHCIPNNASMYLNGTCQTTNAIPAVIPP